jgi:hypothetical protein
MENLTKLFKEIGEKKFTKSERAGSPIIKTTERNVMKRDFMEALRTDIENAIAIATESEALDVDVIVGFTADGLVVAVANDKLKTATNEVAFKIEAKVANLDYDVESEIEALELENAEKEAKKASKARVKAEKMARDKERREAEKRAKEAE